MSRDLHILHVIAGLHPRAGGPSRVVVDLADALGDLRGLKVTLLTQARPGEEVVAPRSTGVDLRVRESRSRVALALGLPIRKALTSSEVMGAPDVVQSHGLWLPVNHWATAAAVRRRLPLVIQTHGMLHPWALRNKAAKKRLALAVFQGRDLATARLFIATSAAEHECLRRFGLRQPIAVVPNGVELHAGSPPAAPPPAGDSRRTALFLSRVHPVKGLITLIKAWANLRPSGWRLRIAGPDEGGHLAEILAEVRRTGLGDTVEYVGELSGDAKTSAFRGADLFVLPSLSENFGVVVAEALAHGLPVITTRGAPWADLETHRCGWWIDIGVEPLVEALREATALDDAALGAMGARGQAYVQRFAWAGIARQTLDVYRWLLGQGARPDCVRLD